MFKDESEFRKVIDRLDINTEPNQKRRDDLRRQMLNVFNETKQQSQKPIAPHGVLRRIIMKNPITKLAAAAAIIIAVLIGINQFGGTPAFAEVVQSLLNIQTATFKMSMEVEGVPPQKFDCMYAEPVRMRQIAQDNNAIVISDFQRGKIVTLMPSQNKAFVIEMENMPDEDQGKSNMFREIRRHLQEAQDTEDESVQFLGEKKIDGLMVIGYHVQRPAVDITVWADPQTKLPVEMTNKSGPTTYTMTDIVFDVELDESLFSLEIPDGYTVQTIEVDASKPKEKDLLDMFRIWVEHMDGNLPSVLDMNASMEFVRCQRKKMKEEGREPSEESMLEMQKTIMKMSRGGMFVQMLTADSDWHYTGEDVKFGDAGTPIFWYRPQGSETYRVIYGDLSVQDVAQENLPE
ncbi:MAG: hypothetical protein GY845_15695 [Planctomycetes bacterium]|nr:hypothetical protein [Planctomycetota bacterium]